VIVTLVPPATWLARGSMPVTAHRPSSTGSGAGVVVTGLEPPPPVLPPPPPGTVDGALVDGALVVEVGEVIVVDGTAVVGAEPLPPPERGTVVEAVVVVVVVAVPAVPPATVVDGDATPPPGTVVDVGFGLDGGGGGGGGATVDAIVVGAATVVGPGTVVDGAVVLTAEPLGVTARYTTCSAPTRDPDVPTSSATSAYWPAGNVNHSTT
jgi:hypothetical protein